MCPPETNCLPPQDGVSLNLISLPPNPISPVTSQYLPYPASPLCHPHVSVQESAEPPLLPGDRPAAPSLPPLIPLKPITTSSPTAPGGAWGSVSQNPQENKWPL